MPIYRYRCSECGAREEHIQKLSDPPMEICDSCGGALAKEMTAAAFHLKGGGWYKDLYSSNKPAESGSTSDSSSTSSDSGGGDSKSSSSSGTSDSGGSSSSSSSDGGSKTSTSTGATSTSAA